MGVLERVVAEQNNVLHKFISTMSVAELNTGGGDTVRNLIRPQSLASPEALEVAREVAVNEWSDSSPMAKKIVSDSDSDSESDTDSENNEDQILVINHEPDQFDIDTIKTIDFSVTDNQSSLISGACVEDINPLDQKEEDGVTLTAVVSSDSDSDSDVDSDVDVSVVTEEVDNDLATDPIVEYELGNPDLASLKVQVLRSMAIEKNLVSKDEAKSMKKNELKDLLS